MKKTCYIYFDKKTGRIKDILKIRKRGRAIYVTCDIEDVIGFLDGSWNINKYVVAFSKPDNQYILLKKENVVKLRQEGQKLIKIPKRRLHDDLVMVYYPDNILEVSLNMENISPLYTTDFKKDVIFEKGTEIRIIVSNKVSGEKMKEFIIDPNEILEDGVKFLKLPEECYPTNVAFYTYKLLNSYSWSVAKNRISSPFRERVKFNIHKAETKRKDAFDYHLIFTEIEKGLSVKNNIEDIQLLRIHGPLEFFITDKNDPHILYLKFKIDQEILEKEEEFVIKTDLDMGNKVILYNHKYISILLERK